MKKLPYEEGTWFAVPLEQGGFATGIVARMAPKGKLLFGYFFGPLLPSIPTLADLIAIEPKSAIWISHFGDLGIYKKTWSIIGKSANWQRKEWTMPAFYRVDPIYGKIKYKIIYDDADPSRVVEEIRLPETAEVGLPDGLAGARFVEARLSMLLAN